VPRSPKLSGSLPCGQQIWYSVTRARKWGSIRTRRTGLLPGQPTMLLSKGPASTPPFAVYKMRSAFHRYACRHRARLHRLPCPGRWSATSRPIKLQPNILLSVATQVADLVSTVISIEALWDSALTIAYQRDPLLARDITALGFDPVHEGHARARKMGYSGVFQQRTEITAREFSRWPRSIPVTSASWGQLQAILWLCESRGGQAHLVIYPYHAQFLQLIKVDGRWPLYEQWKRTLVNVVDRAREGNENLTVWDFSGYHRYSTETIPKNEDNQIVSWASAFFTGCLAEAIPTSGCNSLLRIFKNSWTQSRRRSWTMRKRTPVS
jgi:hypothetical protein